MNYNLLYLKQQQMSQEGFNPTRFGIVRLDVKAVWPTSFTVKKKKYYKDGAFVERYITLKNPRKKCKLNSIRFIILSFSTTVKYFLLQYFRLCIFVGRDFRKKFIRFQPRKPLVKLFRKVFRYIRNIIICTALHQDTYY